jgi:hypothetical protein
MTEVAISFNKEELRHLVNAMNEYLYNMARLERTFDIKIIDTLTCIAAAHKKLLEARAEAEIEKVEA